MAAGSPDPAAPLPEPNDGYVALLARFWVGKDGKLVRGWIEDAHTGQRLALDLSRLVEFFSASLSSRVGAAADQEAEPEERGDQAPGSGHEAEA